MSARGETAKTEAICLGIHPWSRTSHVVIWLTPTGRLTTVVKGAVRPKSFFLGQYDLNYTCEILYYVRGKGDAHALREAAPLDLRAALRGNYRALALAGYCRALADELSPAGDECAAWYALLARTLDRLTAAADESAHDYVGELVLFELEVLRFAGLRPDFTGYDRTAPWSTFEVVEGRFGDGGSGRSLRVAREVAAYLACPRLGYPNTKIPLDAARVIGVFYQFHVETLSDVRRVVLGMISYNEQGK